MKNRLRLPFRLKVPERDELIAYALATLAVGLTIGLAIGPIVSGSATVIQVLIPGPAVTEPDSGGGEVTSAGPELGSPAGTMASTARPGDPGPALPAAPAAAPAGNPVTVPAPEQPDPATPAPNRAEPGPPEPDEDSSGPEPEGILLNGTVLANSPSSRSYWLSSEGELSTVFAATVPDPGLVISTRVVPLSNGTLTESDQRSAMDISKKAKLKGVVSYVDPVAGLLVLSGRGGSLPLAAAGSAALDGILAGNRVEATLNLKVPDPVNFNEVAGPGSAAVNDLAETRETVDRLPIRLAGLRVIEPSTILEITGTLLAVDEEAGSLSLSADSTGLLASAVDLLTPEGFPFEKLRQGRKYSVTANPAPDGFRVTGMSPASGKAAANDPALAFGTHARG